MDWQGTVLVTGAAGNLGRRVIQMLVAHGIPARGLVRTAEQRALVERLGATAALGDLKEPASLVAAVAGATGIISAAGKGIAKGEDTPHTVDFEGNCHLIDQAVKAQVRHVVLISVMGAQHLRQSSVFQAKYHAEQYLRQTAMSYTILRAGGFMSPYAEAWARGGNQGRYDVLGSPTKPVGLISPDDLAQLAVRALWEPGARGKTLLVTTDEALTGESIASIHSRVFGRPVKVRRLPVELLKVARPLVQMVNPRLADFLGFLQAVGEESFVGKPEEIRALFPGFAFEPYESFLRRTQGA